MRCCRKKKKKEISSDSKYKSTQWWTVQGLEFSCLISKMTASDEIKWVGICFHGNPTHPDQRNLVWSGGWVCLHLWSHGSSWWSCCRTDVMTDDPNMSVSSASEGSGNHTNELSSVRWAHNVQEMQLNLIYFSSFLSSLLFITTHWLKYWHWRPTFHICYFWYFVFCVLPKGPSASENWFNNHLSAAM